MEILIFQIILFLIIIIVGKSGPKVLNTVSLILFIFTLMLGVIFPFIIIQLLTIVISYAISRILYVRSIAGIYPRPDFIKEITDSQRMGCFVSIAIIIVWIITLMIYLFGNYSTFYYL